MEEKDHGLVIMAFMLFSCTANYVFNDFDTLLSDNNMHIFDQRRDHFKQTSVAVIQKLVL